MMSLFSNLGRPVRVTPIWLLTLALTAGFAIASPYFLTPTNLANILMQSATIGILAVGLAPVIISGNIDLSVGSMVGLTACLAIGLQPYGVPFAIAAALIAGLGLGLVNGLIIERTGVNSFIVTLGAMIGIRGLAFLYAGDSSLSGTSTVLSKAASLQLGPLSLAPAIFLALVAALHWLLSRHVIGRDLYAIGGDRQAAANAGIPVSSRIIFCFGLSGLMAAICGVAMAARLDSATPSFGRSYELWAIIAVVLGGARLRGGIGSAAGTLAAVLSLGILRNGLNLTNVSPFLMPAIIGVVLILALAIDARMHRNAAFAGE